MSPRPGRIAWAVFLTAAGAFAAVAAAQWADALISGRPVLYGEGAVANAAVLMRDGNPYRDTTGAVAANYPPLYLALSSVADPFRAGRAVTIASALGVAVILWWRARDAGAVPRAALAVGWLALAPVAMWGAAVKPDLLAVALTLGGVVALERSISGPLGGKAALHLRGGLRAPAVTPRAIAGGALLAAAVWAKPTALLPAATVLIYVLIASRSTFRPAAMGAGGVSLIAMAHAVTLGIGDVWLHVVVWNALPWSAEQYMLPLLVVGAATLGIVVTAAAVAGAFRGIALAYFLGAAGVVLLGGREGATINYLIDLAAATSYAAATIAPRLAVSPAFPAGAVLQLAGALAVLSPFGIIPGREPTTGAWGAPERMAVVGSLSREQPHLVEDSGLLVAAGLRPIVDDLFLWSRLAGSGAIDADPILDRVRGGEIATIVSEVSLADLAGAPAYERARWHPLLVSAVLERYELISRDERGLWVYRPR